MIFPFRSNRSKVNWRDPFDPSGRIDREVGERGRRLFIGIHMDSRHHRLCGALCVIEGKGKYIRVIGAKSTQQFVDQTLRANIQSFLQTEDPSIMDWRAIQEDVAMAVAAVAEELKIQAGKYVDRLMTIAIDDPGIWIREPDSVHQFFPLCHPNRVAELTGISVVDSFAVRDLAAGGNGCGLKALPAWLLLADRSKPLANKARLLMQFGDRSNAYYLPASDGLDVEIPDIKFAQFPTRDFLANHFDMETTGFESQLHQWNIAGTSSDNVVQAIRGFFNGLSTDIKSNSAGDIARSYVVAVAQELLQRIEISSVDEIIVDSSDAMLGSWVNQMRRACSDAAVHPASDYFDQANVTNAVLVAILGAMNVDQVPGNVPWVTQANCQRLLGRLTPGNPSNWRFLLKEMADFQPPAMRLRDAI